MAAIVPLPPVPNVIKCVVRNVGNDGRPAVNVIYLEYTGGTLGYDGAAALATAFSNSVAEYWVPMMHPNTSTASVEVTDLTSDTAGQGIASNSVAGTREGGPIGLHSCFLISQLVNVRYRGGHSRNYLPFGTSADLNSDGDWSDASVSAFLGAYNDSIGALILGTYGGATIDAQVSVSYYGPPTVDGKSTLRETPLIRVILESTGNAQLATQRRRVRKTARHR